MTLPTRPCIVCGRPIAKRTTTVYIVPDTGWSPNYQGHRADVKSRCECRRFTNAPYIVSHRKNGDGFIYSFETWDGETFTDKYFCTKSCAQAQGYAAAKFGHRFLWKD